MRVTTYYLQNQVTIESPINNQNERGHQLQSRNERVSPVNIRNECSHQLQSRVTVLELLQISDSDISDNGFEYAYQRNYEKPTKVKKRQKNNNNKYEGDNEALKIRD
ncbi:6975_t:CDS:2, partial [Gigaspora rosea]